MEYGKLSVVRLCSLTDSFLSIVWEIFWNEKKVICINYDVGRYNF